MLNMLNLRRAITGATITAGLLAGGAAPSLAAPVTIAPYAPATLEAYTVSAGATTLTCTPQFTSVATVNNWGTPPTAALAGVAMAGPSLCTGNLGEKLALKAPMPASVDAGVYTFTGPGFDVTGIIATNPSAPAAPPVVGVWTNHAAPDGLSRLKFTNVVVGYVDAGGTLPVRLTASIRYGSTYANTSLAAPRP